MKLINNEIIITYSCAGRIKAHDNLNNNEL